MCNYNKHIWIIPTMLQKVKKKFALLRGTTSFCHPHSVFFCFVSRGRVRQERMKRTHNNGGTVPIVHKHFWNVVNHVWLFSEFSFQWKCGYLQIQSFFCLRLCHQNLDAYEWARSIDTGLVPKLKDNALSVVNNISGTEALWQKGYWTHKVQTEIC